MLLFVFGQFAAAVSVCAAETDKELAEQLVKWGEVYQRDVLPIIRERCVQCHGSEEEDDGLDLVQFSSGELAVPHVEVWEAVAKRVRLNEMPPEGSHQLNDEQKSIFHRWVDARPRQNLCDTLASDETTSWYRGYVMSRRLTRAEYLNAVRDATGVTVDVRFDVPTDGGGGEGFDTNGESLFTSPIHIERYLEIAWHTIDQAVKSKSTEVFRQLADASDADTASKLIKAFAHHAWRRPIQDSDADRLMELFDQAIQRGETVDQAIRQPLAAVLVSPNFLFVIEKESPAGGVQRLTPHQLAMRLSLLVWSSIPDHELLSAADEDRLQNDDQVIAQLHRMLRDPKSLALGENFGLQWLGLANFLTTAAPDHELYPEFDETLAADLREEAIRCVAGVFVDDTSLLDLIESKHVYVNGRLAAHYGMDLPSDAPWQRAATAEQGRGGVITMGAVLVNTSYPRRTSPVLRGRWLLEDLLGSHVPPPPPNVPALEATTSEKTLTLRQRLEEHRTKPECAACHNRMDPLGFGLENFDALGRWRQMDAGIEIDASGKLPSGEAFSGATELKALILARSGEFERHFVRKLLGFTLGRELNKFDDCVVDECLKQLAANDHRARVVLERIVTSYPFQHRFFKAAEKAP